MNIKLPSVKNYVNTKNNTKFQNIRLIKSIIIMILTYWIDISETRKTYYKKIYDQELEKNRILGLRIFANPRLINFLLLTRQDGRRLNDINNSLYGALEHGMTYESNNPYACPRILSIGHAFSHFDSAVDETAGLGNPNKAHFLLDILIFHAKKPFDEIEVGIIKTLIKSRITIFLSSDYRSDEFDMDSENKLNKIREMFLSILVIELIADLVNLSCQLDFRVHLKKISDALIQRIALYSSSDDLKNYDFLDFINAFVGSIRVNRGDSQVDSYSQTDLIELRNIINSLAELNNNFCWVKEIIELTDIDPFNIEYLESIVLPQFDQILTSKIEQYHKISLHK